MVRIKKSRHLFCLFSIPDLLSGVVGHGEIWMGTSMDSKFACGVCDRVYTVRGRMRAFKGPNSSIFGESELGVGFATYVN